MSTFSAFGVEIHRSLRSLEIFGIPDAFNNIILMRNLASWKETGVIYEKLCELRLKSL